MNSMLIGEGKEEGCPLSILEAFTEPLENTSSVIKVLGNVKRVIAVNGVEILGHNEFVGPARLRSELTLRSNNRIVSSRCFSNALHQYIYIWSNHPDERTFSPRKKLQNPLSTRLESAEGIDT